MGVFKNDRFKYTLKQNTMAWIMRAAILVYVFSSYYQRSIAHHYDSEYFWLGAFYIISSVFIFTGGFVKSDLFTRIPSYLFAIVLFGFLIAYIVRFHHIDGWWAGHLLLMVLVVVIANTGQDKL